MNLKTIATLTFSSCLMMSAAISADDTDKSGSAPAGTLKPAQTQARAWFQTMVAHKPEAINSPFVSQYFDVVLKRIAPGNDAYHAEVLGWVNSLVEEHEKSKRPGATPALPAKAPPALPALPVFPAVLPAAAPAKTAAPAPAPEPAADAFALATPKKGAPAPAKTAAPAPAPEPTADAPAPETPAKLTGSKAPGGPLGTPKTAAKAAVSAPAPAESDAKAAAVTPAKPAASPKSAAVGAGSDEADGEGDAKDVTASPGVSKQKPDGIEISNAQWKKFSNDVLRGKFLAHVASVGKDKWNKLSEAERLAVQKRIRES